MTVCPLYGVGLQPCVRRDLREKSGRGGCDCKASAALVPIQTDQGGQLILLQDIETVYTIQVNKVSRPEFSDVVNSHKLRPLSGFFRTKNSQPIAKEFLHLISCIATTNTIHAR